LHYGGQLAAPVFKEVATKLYAMYIDQKPASYALIDKDLSSNTYTGHSSDLKNIYQTLKVGYTDSTMQSNWANVFSNSSQSLMKAKQFDNRTMPDVKGMGLKDAVYLLENLGLKVNVKGKGKIVSQSVEPGTALAKGITVILELKG
jgi:cell division protein FtsI (penicillin-binding protein 3)